VDEGLLPEADEWPALMRQAQTGDGDAYALVLRALLPTLRVRVRRRIYDETLVEDVIQDTLLTVHRLRHTYDPTRPMMPWINAIVAARSIDTLRKRGRAQWREVSDDDAIAQAVDIRSSKAADKLGVDQEVNRLLAFLPARQRAVVEAVKLREMSLDEAATLNRTSVSAIKALLHRAFETLRKHKNPQIQDHDHG